MPREIALIWRSMRQKYTRWLLPPLGKGLLVTGATLLVVVAVLFVLVTRRPETEFQAVQEQAAPPLPAGEATTEVKPVVPELPQQAPRQITLEGMPRPTQWPVVIPFGWRYHPVYKDWRFHPGVDLAVPSGAPVKAVLPGIVAEISGDAGRGLVIVLAHGPEYTSVYAGLARSFVKSGDTVSPGTILGLAGGTHELSSSHLHFELRKNGEPVDPETFWK